MKPFRAAPTVVFLLAGALLSPLPAQLRVGRRADGAAVLPNGWAITPAGRQLRLSTLPMSLALSPDGEYALALNGGFLPPSITVVELGSQRIVFRQPLADGWHGLRFNRAGDRLFVGGGSRASVYVFDFLDGKLKNQREFPAVPEKDRREWNHIGDVALSADERLLYAADVFADRVSVLNAETGFLVGSFKTGARPYRLLPNADGKTMWISHWGEPSVGLYDLEQSRMIEKIPVGGRPTDLLIVEGPIAEDENQENPRIVRRLFVACANTNGVWVFGLTEKNRAIPLETIPVGPSAGAPAGSTPTALALGPDGKRLYVVCSGVNSIVVADVSGARSLVMAAIPTGWFPTAAAVTPEGGLVYLNGKGSGSHAAPQGPDPTRRGKQGQYVASLQKGTMGILPPLPDAVLAETTSRVIENSPYDDALLAGAAVPPSNPVPDGAGRESPIRHVIYVIKENRTYDQIFGGLERGEGQASLVVFGEDVAPNHHKLAREFVLFDNFYAAGDVSADGLMWTTAAMSTDFVDKLWPSYYARRRKVRDFDGREAAARPAAGHLGSNALSAGLTLRNYGLGTVRGRDGSVVVLDRYLAQYTNTDYPPFDLDTPDGERVGIFLEEFERLAAQGSLPRLMFVYLPGDHTAGRAPGKPTARAMMAEHDYALGRLVEGVSKSAAWERTAIFIVEDDAQDGADHVDSHRSVALIASPYAKRGAVDSTLYTTLSLLRTIELILGLRPMTQFDASAQPMWRAFTSRPDATPFEAARPEQSFEEKNPAGGAGAPRRVERGPAHERSAPIVARARTGDFL